MVNLRVLFLISFICLVAKVFGQADARTNHIVIWDVTESMKGMVQVTPAIYDNEANIWDEVKDAIIQTITDLPSAPGAITILPFQHEVLERSSFPNSSSGRSKAIAYVRNYDRIEKNSTNICKAWETASDYHEPEALNLIYMFTDGNQSSKFGDPYGVDCFEGLITKYCNESHSRENKFTFYLAFKEASHIDEDLKERLCENCPEIFRCVDPDVPIGIVTLRPPPFVIINTHDSPLSTKVVMDPQGQIPSDFTIDLLVAQNDYGISLLNTSNIKLDGNHSFSLDVSLPEDYRQTGPEELTIPIVLVVSEESNSKIVQLTPSKLDLKIMSIRERTLHIYVGK